ncbi:MAG: hypothetical protein ACREL7_13440 [Longimicrobiales bacterium]
MSRLGPMFVGMLAMLVCVAPLSAQRAQAGATGTPESVLLRFQIIQADGFTETDPAIADVSEVLRELFRFRGYRLAAESVVRVMSGAKFLQKTSDHEGVEYVIQGDAMMHGDGRSDSVRLGVELWRERPQAGGPTSVQLIQTSLTVPIGQTVVVGSARTSPDVPTTILVVRPEAR